MRISLMVFLMASLLLASCGGWSESRSNPRNWFGKSREVPIQEAQINTEAANPLIPQKSAISKRPEKADTSVAIASISELRVERTPTGAIILATGIASRQGAYDAELRLEPVEEDDSSTTLTYTFRVVYPDYLTTSGSAHSRTIHVARSLTTQDLSGTSLIRVRAEQNTLETRRR